jgi:hypothetical protein
MSFRLYALTFNGRSVASDTFTFNICTVPKGMQPPFKISSQQNNLLLGWTNPTDNGGCPVTGYAVFRDDSIGGDVTVEINQDDDANIRNNPVLKQALVTNFPTGTESNFFRYKMRVYNREGYSESSLVTFLNAGPPDAPSLPVDLIEQSATYLIVSMPLIGDANNGGS